MTKKREIIYILVIGVLASLLVYTASITVVCKDFANNHNIIMTSCVDSLYECYEYECVCDEETE